MVVCFIALFIFAVMGIFSAKYRSLTKEALNCVFRKITLRKCKTNLDERIRAKVTGKLMQRFPGFAGMIYRKFELFSWIFTIILIVSLALSVQAIYNLVIYGTCTPGSEGECVITEAGKMFGVTEPPAGCGCAQPGCTGSP